MIDELIDIMIDEGMRVQDYADIYESIADAVAEGKIKAISKNGEIIGFFSWRESIKNGKKCIFVNNMCIKRRYRNPANLLFLRRFFRDLYPDMYFTYWHNSKKDTVYYCK